MVAAVSHDVTCTAGLSRARSIASYHTWLREALSVGTGAVFGAGVAPGSAQPEVIRAVRFGGSLCLLRGLWWTGAEDLGHAPHT